MTVLPRNAKAGDRVDRRGLCFDHVAWKRLRSRTNQVPARPLSSRIRSQRIHNRTTTGRLPTYLFYSFILFYYFIVCVGGCVCVGGGCVGGCVCVGGLVCVGGCVCLWGV